MSRLFHPLLALIASATDSELAKYVEYLKHENTILRARLPKQVHTTHEERQTLLKYGKAIGRAIEELITIVSPGTFYRWLRDEKECKPRPMNPKGGQRKPKELRGHLDHLIGDFVEYYNAHRAHMERDHLPPVRTEPDEVTTLTMDQIEVKSYVGGLVKSFGRKAA